MAFFRYIGTAPPRPDGTYCFRVRSKKFLVTFQQDQVFEIPDDQVFVLKCIRGHLDWETKQQAYEEIVQ